MTLASTTIAATRLPVAVFADQLSGGGGTRRKSVFGSDPIGTLKELLQ